MNDTSPHDTSGGAASANTVRGRSGSTVGPSGSHHIIGPLQKAKGPKKTEKTARSKFWDTYHTFLAYLRRSSGPYCIPAQFWCMRDQRAHHMAVAPTAALPAVLSTGIADPSILS